ncbi:ArnT family glycosyltransferase [Hyphobacterium sp.]|uniref:ArnT family glycosyltransferase n=1 Tax=Hyphobacterium sp. TaxID=2004662 RepID=UPI003BAB412D
MADWIGGHKAWWIIGALAAIAALSGIFTVQPLDRDESRYAQATTQMLETGDFVEIRYQDDDRNKKPVGIYWLQALSVAIVSDAESRQIWAYRLPSVLGAILAAMGCFWAGVRLMPREAAFAGASLFAVSVLLGSEGSIAKTDAMLAGVTTLAMAALVALRTGGGRREALIFWAMLGLGILIKGPVTPMVAGLTGLALLIWERKWSWIKPLFFWPGPVSGALIVLPWLIAVQIATDGEFLREAIGVDLAPRLASGIESHGGLPGYHLLALSLLSLPVIFFLVPGLWKTVKDAQAEDDQTASAARFLIAWILPSWLVFELMPTKLPHYPLPVYPALALIAGSGWSIWRTSPAWTRLMSVFLGLFGALAFCVLLIAGPLEYGASDLPGYVGAGIFVVLVFGVAVTLVRNRPAPALMLALIAALGGHFLLKGVSIPTARDLDLSRQAANAVDQLSEANDLDALPVISSYTEPSFVFLTATGTRLVAFEEMGEAISAMSGPFASVEDTARSGSDLDVLEQIETGVCARAEVPGFNYSRGLETVLIVRLHNCEEAR